MPVANVSLGDIIEPSWGNAVADAINPTAWTAVTFAGTWVNEGSAGFQTAQYRRINDVVFVRGIIKSGTINTPAFTLPAGFRPPATLDFVTISSGSTLASLRVTAAGVFTPVFGSTTWVSINCQFSVTA